MRLKSREEAAVGWQGDGGRGKSMGKRPSRVNVMDEAEEGEEGEDKAVVLFACRHLWHRECLVKDGVGKGGLGEEIARSMGRGLKCGICG